MPPNEPPDGDDDRLHRLLQMRREALLRNVRDTESSSNSDQGFLEDGKKRIANSNTGIILYTHKILKCGMTVLFLLSIISMCFLLFVLGWMLFEYVGNLVGKPEELQAQLTHIWTALSGAFVVVFFQFIISIGKKLSVNGSEGG